MSDYEIDRKTMQFVNLTPESFAELEGLARECLAGRVEMQHPAFVQWVKLGGHETAPALFTYSVAFVQRVLLSLLDHLKVQK